MIKSSIVQIVSQGYCVFHCPQGLVKKEFVVFFVFCFFKVGKGVAKKSRQKNCTCCYELITSFYFYWRSLSIWNLTRHRPSISFIVYHYKHLSLSTEFSMKISLRNLIYIYKEIQILLYNLATIGQVCPPPPKKNPITNKPSYTCIVYNMLTLTSYMWPKLGIKNRTDPRLYDVFFSSLDIIAKPTQTKWKQFVKVIASYANLLDI